MIKFSGDLHLDFEKATAEIVKLKDRILGYQEQIASLRESVKRLKQSKDSAKRKYTESLAEKDAVIKELQNRLAHAEALLNHDGNNISGTSQNVVVKKYVYGDSYQSYRHRYSHISVGYSLVVVLETFRIKVYGCPVQRIVDDCIETGVDVILKHHQQRCIEKEEHQITQIFRLPAVIEDCTQDGRKQDNNIEHKLIKAYADGRKITAYSSRRKKVYYDTFQYKGIISVLTDVIYFLGNLRALTHFDGSRILPEPCGPLLSFVSTFFRSGHGFVLGTPSGLFVIYLRSVTTVFLKY